MAGRIGGYVIGLWFWAVLLTFTWHLYPWFNAAAWHVGVGEYLVQRPWAAVHHRVNLFYDWVIVEPDDGTRELDSDDHRRRSAVIETGKRWFVIVIASYAALVVTPIEVMSWLDHRDRCTSPSLS